MPKPRGGPIKDPATAGLQPAASRILAESAIPPAALLYVVVDPIPPLPAGGAFELHVRLTIADGYHVQTHQPAEREAFSTVARLRGDLAMSAQEWHYPPGTPVGAAAPVALPSDILGPSNSPPAAPYPKSHLPDGTPCA